MQFCDIAPEAGSPLSAIVSNLRVKGAVINDLVTIPSQLVVKRGPAEPRTEDNERISSGRRQSIFGETFHLLDHGDVG